MSLEFVICPTCKESHALMRNGEMSIHYVAGERCAGSGDAQAHIKRAKALEERLEVEAAARKKRSDRERARRELDTEFEAAQRVANERRLRSLIGEPKPKTPLDRKIYATRGVHTVSGGLSGHGKRK